MKNCWMDSESIQFIGPTMLLQYGFSNSTKFKRENIKLHYVMHEPVIKTLNLIEEMMECRFVGFNLTHDMFHVSRLYNVLSHFSPLEKPNDDLDFFCDCYEKPVDKCLLPKKAVDLMLIGQKEKFQALVRQKPIRIPKVPKDMVKEIIEHLEERIELNPLYFAGFKEGRHWQINELWNVGQEKQFREIGNAEAEKSQIHPELVNLVLPFKPKKGLKDIMKHLLGKEVKHFDSYCKKYKEIFWNPMSTSWREVYAENDYMWRNDSNQIKYAIDDVDYTYELDKYFEFPDESTDSVLACMTANQYHKGYSVDVEEAKKLQNKYDLAYYEVAREVDVKTPRDCLRYLKNVALVPEAITDTKAETLVGLSQVEDDEPTNLNIAAQKIIAGRKAFKRKSLVDRLVEKKKMYAQFKISGTATNRKSAGMDEVQNAANKSKTESISPHGLPREKEFRKIVTFNSDKGWGLSGGDAESFEVSIAAAVFRDKDLTKTLLEGKKFHALVGVAMYKVIYNNAFRKDNEKRRRADSKFFDNEEIRDSLIKQKDLKVEKLESLLYDLIRANEEVYTSFKTGVFAWFYGGTNHTIAENINLDIEIVDEGMLLLESKYPGIRKFRENIWNNFQALRQPGGLGTEVECHEIKTKIETFMGHVRDFSVEVSTMKTIFDLAQNLPDNLKSKDEILRNPEKGTQTKHGAIMSALFAAAFSIQSQIMKIASNFVIQSPGAEINKKLEERIINTFQPRGIHNFNIMTFNMHDEMQIPHKEELGDKLETVVREFENEYRKFVPLYKVDWKKGKENWSETH